MKLFKIATLTLITLFILTALLFETSAGKRFLGSMLVKALNRAGVTLEIGEISGRFPQEMDITDLKMPGLTVQKLHLELSLLPLLGGELRIQELRANQVHISSSTETAEGKMPLALSIRHYHLEHVTFEDLPTFAIEGSASLRRKGRSMKTEGKLIRYDVPDALLSYEVSRNRLGKLEGFFEIDSSTLSVFEPWIEKEDTEGKIHATVHLQGKPEAFSGKFNGVFEDTAKTWQFKGRVNQPLNKPIHLPKIVLSTEGLRISGSVWFDDSYEIQKAIFQSRLKTELFLPNFEGNLWIDGAIEASESGLNTHATWKSEQLNVYGVSLAKPHGSITGVLLDNSFSGNLEANAGYAGSPWALHTHIFAKAEEVRLENIRLDADLLSLQGNLSLPIVPGALWVGNLSFQHANLSLLHGHLSGIGEGTVSLFGEDGQQKVEVDLTGRKISYGPISAESGHITTGEGFLSATFDHVKWKKLILDTAILELTQSQFSLDVTGKWLQLYATGDWERGGLTIRTADGRFLQHNTHLLAPMQMTWGHEQFSFDRLYLALGLGRFDGNLQMQNHTTDAKFIAEAIPLELLSLNPMNSSVQGTFSASGTLHKDLASTDADWQWKVEDGILDNQPEILFWEDEPPTPLTMAGQMQGSLHKEQLKLKTDLTLRDKPFLALDLTTPLHLDANFHPSFPTGTSKGSIQAHGKLEDLFDFVDLGMHRIAGQIDCDLTFSQGAVKGGCTIQDGYYQNYVTGTELHNITALLEGTPLGIELKSLKANALNGNEVLSGSGMIHLSLHDRFPYHIEATFDQLDVVQIDLVTAKAKGHVSIDGDLRSAIATGTAQILKSNVTIPNHIPRSYPDLQVIYKHRPITPLITDAQKLPFPLHLDLKISAPDAVFIGGRGLTSEWNGDFTVGGTYTEPTIEGSLKLIEGEFSFASKRFKLTNGSLSMQGGQYQLPLIDITGTITEQAVIITTRLKGPLNRPQLTFQSLPALPLSAILSHLLFGKDLSDVTGLQALQLAGTVAAVAGEGPDILEITRKSLGVDRLQIVMTPTKAGEGYEGKETIALEIGKIITPGVILTIKQSASYSNPDIGVEADLLHGFVLEAQSQQQPEQGKFSLKWNVNY